jgi:hypothetical protein
MTTTTDLISQFKALLSELRTHSPTSTPSFERVQFIILKSYKAQSFPDLNNVEREVEAKFKLNHGDQIFLSAKPNSIVLEYAITQDLDRLQFILTGQPRITVCGQQFRLFTRLKNYYRVTIRGFLPSDLQNEGAMRKLINFLEPQSGAKFIIPTFKTQSGFVGFRGDVVAFFERCPLKTLKFSQALAFVSTFNSKQ